MKEPSLNANDVLLLDQPLVKVPITELRTNLRTATRLIERDFGQCSSTSAALARRSADDALARSEALQNVDAMLVRMRGLKRKLSELSESNNSHLSAVHSRTEHLQALQCIDSFGSQAYAEWSRVRLARQLVDHLLRRGYLDAAAQLAKDSDVESLVDIDLFRECVRIERCLCKHSVSEALAWCKENQSSLKKMKSTMEFELRFQEFIELVRAKKTNEAIFHSRKYLAAWSETHMPQIRQAVVLLAFGPDTTCPPYIKYFDMDRWSKLATSFRYTLLTMHSLAPMSMLSLSLHTGLAALKSPVCFSESDFEHNSNCPICASYLKHLAQRPTVPWAHHENSLIVCKLSGKIMTADEGREPMAFPKTGRVYSREALEKMAMEHGGNVTCPATNETCRFTSLLRVYIS